MKNQIRDDLVRALVEMRKYCQDNNISFVSVYREAELKHQAERAKNERLAKPAHNQQDVGA